MSNRVWVTLATNDSYGLGALVLAHSLRRAGSAYPAVVLITPAVTESMRDRLRAVFADLVIVDVLDSLDAAHLALLQRPELGITFTKLHCWNLTQYEKCVFLDADTLVIQNCDELFDREELSAAPDVGWPDCFNSGVFVFRPSADTFNELIKFAQERGSFDGGDQGLLNSFFSDWAHGDINKHLPFLYNVTSAAFYSYLPALKHFGQNLKIIHFIGAVKPWLQPFNWDSRSVSAPDHLRELLQLWWDLFVSQVHSQLDVAMVEGQEAHPDEPGPPEDLGNYFHYLPVVDPDSEFPWHHPDTKTHEERSEPQIDMTDIFNPWEQYRGNIAPSKEDTLRCHSEIEGTVDHEEIRKYAWEHQVVANAAPFHVKDTHQPYEPYVQSQHDSSYQQSYYHETHESHVEDHRHHDQHEHHHYQHDHHQYHQQHHDQQQHVQQNEQPQYHQHQQDHRHCEHHWQPDQVHTYRHDVHTHYSHEQYVHHEPSHHDCNEHFQYTEHNGHIDDQTHSHDPQSRHSSHTQFHHCHIASHKHEPQNRVIDKPQHEHHDHIHLGHTDGQVVGVYQVHLDHVVEEEPPKTKPVEMNGDVSDTDSEFYEEVRPRHPYDGFYLRHRATIDSHGRKICSHEIPIRPPSLSESPPPDDDLVLETEGIPTTSDYEGQSGVAGNLARVVAGGGAQRDAVDELTRRQGWEAGNIDYMGADSFDNIWAKISQTLNQPRPSPPRQPAVQPQPEVSAAPPVVKEAEITPASIVPDTTAPNVEAPVAPVVAPATVATPVPVEVPAPVAIPADAPVPAKIPATVEAVVPVEKLVPVEPAVEAVPSKAAVPEQTVPAPAAPAVPAPAPVPIEVSKTTETKAPVEAKASVEAKAPVEAKATEAKAPAKIPVPSPVPIVAAAEIPKTVEAVETAAIKEAAAKESKAKTETVGAAAAVPAAAVIPKTVAKADEVVTVAASPEKASDSPPLANTPSKEGAPPLPAAKSEERRKPAGKLQLRPPAAADPLPTPDSELEDAAELASSIIAGELRTPTVTAPASATPPALHPLTQQEKRLSVEEPDVLTPPIGAVSLAQIGVKPAAKGKASTAAQIESSVAEGTEAPRKKLVKKVVKKEAAAGDAPVPPPRKKEKKPKDK